MAELAVQLGALFLAAVGVILTGVYRLNGTERRLADKIALHQVDTEKTINAKVGAVYKEIEGDRRATDQVIQAVRQQIHDDKLETVKEFQKYVRRDTFHQFLEDQREARRNFEADLKERLAELERKIDRMLEREKAPAP